MFADVLNQIYRPTEYVAKDWDLIPETDLRLRRLERVSPPDPGTIYHAHEIVTMCPRQEVLKHLHQVESSRLVDAKLARTFDFGHAFHLIVQDRWFGPWGWLQGDWRCLGCGKLYEDQLRPSECLAELGNGKTKRICQSTDFRYREMEITNLHAGVVAHPDGVLLRDGLRKVLELKSANEYYFQRIKRDRMPLQAHEDQAQLYIWITNIPRAVILYFAKDSSEMIEFKVERSEERIKILLDRVRVARQGMKTGRVPAERPCENRDCSRAKKCPVMQQCFAEVASSGAEVSPACSGRSL